MISDSNGPATNEQVNVLNYGSIGSATVNTLYDYTDGGAFTNYGSIKSLANIHGYTYNFGYVNDVSLQGTGLLGSSVSNRDGGQIQTASVDGASIGNYAGDYNGGYIGTVNATNQRNNETQVNNYYGGKINSVITQGKVLVNNGMGGTTTQSNLTSSIEKLNISGYLGSFQNGKNGVITEAVLDGTGMGNGTYTSFNDGNISKLTMSGSLGSEVSNGGSIGELNVKSGIMTNHYSGEINSLTLDAGQVKNNGASAIIKAFTINGGEVINGESATLGTGTLAGRGTLVNNAHVDDLTLRNARMSGTGTFDTLTINGINGTTNYEGGLLDTTKFTGLIGDLSFVDNGGINFLVGLNTFSTVNIFGEIDLSNGIVSVEFDNSFATSDWTKFDLANLFNFDTGLDVGSFADDVSWRSFLLSGLDNIDYSYTDSWIVRGT
ncbi:MAG: hypothetical protein LBU65_16960, partial [Planctomycetaceae bacterium]|nr:hypothetical protein [Planctomycetaceae bacterium]